MSQLSFLTAVGIGSKKKTKRASFLDQMERVIPWTELLAVIEPHYAKRFLSGKGGRPAKSLRMMLRIYFLQQWFGLSDSGVEEALYESLSMQRFVGVELGHDAIPDETTILKFRHMLEQNDLPSQLLAVVNEHLKQARLLVREGTIVDATIIAAPPSTKNRDRARDPEMSSTKKGNQWYFGMKAHIGVDSKSGLVHSVVCGTASEHDSQRMPELLHGDEREIYGDKAYHDEGRREAHRRAGRKWRVTAKARRGKALTEQQRRWNWSRSRVRAKVEHVFGVIKNLWGYRKVRYRGLRKNECQINTLVALANLYLARRELLRQ